MARKSMIEKMEEAAGISNKSVSAESLPAKGVKKFMEATNPPVMPYGKGEVIKSGDVARKWTGPTPWRDNSTRGSAPFSDAELKQGYRKVK